ncbi:unnamed protein product [Effrenium voratum]|uniref:ATP synthase subunit a, chloroplastic n=1 Tax=Effrenium voratum TaxID=2562239 RepID=A0AA36N4K3_9DINO|nr:unnamed protein product [Effrenium voratum]
MKKHEGDMPLMRCYPCSELCRFAFEESVFDPRCALKDPEVVALHLALAAAAAEGGALEPVPPPLAGTMEGGKLTRAVRSAAAQPSGGFASWFQFEPEPRKEAPVDRGPARLLAQMPSMQKLCQAEAGGGLRELLERDVGSAGLPLLRFLSCCPLSLRKLRSEDQLQLGGAQFAVQAGPSEELAFARLRGTRASSFGLHGSPLRNWYSILRNGLQVLSNSELMGSGARFGPGIYLAERVSTARHYCNGFAGSRYNAGLGEALQVLAVVEYVDDPVLRKRHSEGIVTVSDHAAVALRYILVYSLSSVQPMSDRLDVDKAVRDAPRSGSIDHSCSKNWPARKDSGVMARGSSTLLRVAAAAALCAVPCFVVPRSSNSQPQRPELRAQQQLSHLAQPGAAAEAAAPSAFSGSTLITAGLFTARSMVSVCATVMKAKAPVSEFGAPSGVRNFQEMALGFTSDIAKNNLGESFYRPWVPFISTIFLFIFVSNWSGALIPWKMFEIPAGELAAPTNNINTTVALSLLTSLAYFGGGLAKKGLGYFARYVKPTPILLPINILEDFTKPLSLSFRLFGNVVADELTVGVLCFLVPFVIPLPIMGLGLFAGSIQALIFSTLAAAYIHEALE